MTKKIRLKNLLAVEGRKLASDEHGQLTAAEWLYLYEKIKDDLPGAQAVVFAGYAERIRRYHPESPLEDVAL